MNVQLVLFKLQLLKMMIHHVLKWQLAHTLELLDLPQLLQHLIAGQVTIVQVLELQIQWLCLVHLVHIVKHGVLQALVFV